MILRLIIAFGCAVLISAAKAEGEFEMTPSYVCSVSYSPYTGPWYGDAAISSGDSGYVLAHLSKSPDCGWTEHDRFAYFCSKNATAAICAKPNEQYEPFALQMLYNSLLNALERKTAFYSFIGDCMGDTGTKCVASVYFIR
jgi:hypothetical protein